MNRKFSKLFAASVVFVAMCLFVFICWGFGETCIPPISKGTRWSTPTAVKADTVNANVASVQTIPVEKVEKCTAKTIHLSTKSLPITGLVSFPGSGNTWSRHLIQQISGLGTSSCYCDEDLHNSGFPFECHTDKSKTLVVKAHGIECYETYRFQKVVLLIRNPYDALLSYANFAEGGHTGRPSKPILIKAAQKMFAGSLRWYTNLPNRTITTFTGPVHVLQYELLKTNMAGTLTKLADFLNVNVTRRDIACTIKLQEGNFYRKVSKAEHIAELKEAYKKEQLLEMKRAADITEEMLRTAYNVDLDIGWSPLERLLFDEES